MGQYFGVTEAHPFLGKLRIDSLAQKYARLWKFKIILAGFRKDFLNFVGQFVDDFLSQTSAIVDCCKIIIEIGKDR